MVFGIIDGNQPRASGTSTVEKITAEKNDSKVGVLRRSEVSSKHKAFRDWAARGAGGGGRLEEALGRDGFPMSSPTSWSTTGSVNGWDTAASWMTGFCASQSCAFSSVRGNGVAAPIETHSALSWNGKNKASSTACHFTEDGSSLSSTTQPSSYSTTRSTRRTNRIPTISTTENETTCTAEDESQPLSTSKTLLRSQQRRSAPRLPRAAIAHSHHHQESNLQRTAKYRTGGGDGLNKKLNTMVNLRPKEQSSSSTATSTAAHHVSFAVPDLNSSNSGQPRPRLARIWKSAVDPKSGRTYYYDAVTRETQWRKPIELASEQERAETRRKEREQRDFFAAMESNILRSLATGAVPGTPHAGGASSDEDEEPAPLGQIPMPSKARRKSSVKLEMPNLVRTISAMDDKLLAELTRIETTGDASIKPAIYKKETSPNSVAGLPHPVVAAGGGSGRTMLADAPREDSFCDPFALDDAEKDRAIAQVKKAAEEMRHGSDRGAPDATSGPEAATETDASSDDAVAERRTSKTDPTGIHKKMTGPATPFKGLAKPSMAKRNTCGTIYVGSTMSAPDKDATIKCVCGVYRAHMLQSAREDTSLARRSRAKFDEYEVFNDRADARSVSAGKGNDRWTNAKRHDSFSGIDEPTGLRPSGRTLVVDGSSSDDVGASEVAIEALSLESVESLVPSLDEITNFYRDVFRRSQMEPDCIIMSLIYVERLIKDTKGGVRPRRENWRSVLFASMVMASKVWDDLSMWNADFSQTCPAGVRFPLQRINELELAMLGCLKYNVKVSASEYAKYYFLLRSMLIRSGLAGDDIASLSPLDVEGAKKLEHVSASFQVGADTKAEVKKLRNLRSKSLGEVESKILSKVRGELSSGTSNDTSEGSPKTSMKVSLEHVVQM